MGRYSRGQSTEPSESPYSPESEEESEESEPSEILDPESSSPEAHNGTDSDSVSVASSAEDGVSRQLDLACIHTCHAKCHVVFLDGATSIYLYWVK